MPGCSQADFERAPSDPRASPLCIFGTHFWRSLGIVSGSNPEMIDLVLLFSFLVRWTPSVVVR